MKWLRRLLSLAATETDTDSLQENTRAREKATLGISVACEKLMRCLTNE